VSGSTPISSSACSPITLTTSSASPNTPRAASSSNRATALEEYFAKTHVCQREYDGLDPGDVDTGVDIQNPYSGMQTAIFEMLEDHGRLYRWTTEEDLVECVENIP
jgi:hypothetical protein